MVTAHLARGVDAPNKGLKFGWPVVLTVLTVVAQMPPTPGSIAGRPSGQPVQACDFCMPAISGFGRGVREADGVATATVMGRQLVFSGEQAAQTATTYRIDSPLRGTTPATGQTLRTVLPLKAVVATRQALLLFDCGQPRGDDDPVRTPELVEAVGDSDRRLAAYFAGAFQVDAATADEPSRKPAGGATNLLSLPARRVRWYARWLEDANPLIAQDAYEQFAGVSLVHLQAALTAGGPSDDAANQPFPRAETLRVWLASAEVTAGRKGLYALMLGLVGSRGSPHHDDKRLREMADATTDEVVLGGLLAGLYLVSGGEAKPLAELVANPRAKLAHRRAALRVVRFVLTQPPGGGASPWEDPTRVEPLREVLRGGLGDPTILPALLAEFTALREDWMPQAVREIWADPRRRTEDVRSAVMHFVRSSPQPLRDELYRWIDAHP